MAEIMGTLVPNITFFTKDNKLDKELCSWHMNWMLDKGVNGLFVTGSYGAGPLMTNQERIEVFKLAREAADSHPGSFVIAHVGCADTNSTVELARAAEELGCDAAGAVPPFYYSYTEDKVIGFYKAMVDAVKIPVFAYNNPTTTKVSMTPEMIMKLQAVGVKGIKDSSMSAYLLTRVFYDAKLNNKDFKTIIGTSTGWLPFSLMGIDTMIAGMCNYAPEIVSKLHECTSTGDIEKAEKVYLLMMNYLAKCRFTDSTIVSHMVLKARGFDCGSPRLPMTLPAFDDPKYAQLAQEFNDAIATLRAIEQS